MAITSGFFNGEDRLYDAEQMSSIFDGIIRDGIFATIGNRFAVNAGSANTINVGTGRAWFNHTWTLNDAPLPLDLGSPEVVLGRIDAVVIDVNTDITVRENSIILVRGIPGSIPERPVMVHSEEHHQYALAYINRKPSKVVTQADITNVVGTGDTPFVTGPLETISIDAFVGSMQTQWTNWYQENTTANQSMFEEWMLSQQSSFEKWFDELKVTLEGNVAANLTKMVLDLQEKFNVLMREYAIYDDLVDSDGDPIRDSSSKIIDGRIIYKIA